MTRDSFPRQKARTRSFTLGAPRSFRVADDGSRVAFIRSKAGDDPRGCLWVFDLATGEERCVVDPAALTGEERLTQEERDRRERMRERLTGVTTYDTDPSLTMAAFVLDGQVYVADLVDGNVQALVGCVEERSMRGSIPRGVASPTSRAARSTSRSSRIVGPSARSPARTTQR